MAYFLHNKYDAASIAALAGINTEVHTVIDYYTNYETYKYLDVSAGFGILYDALSYLTPSTQVYDGQSLKDSSHFNFSSSLIIKSIQMGVATTTGGADVAVTIAEVNPTKCMVLLNGGGTMYSSDTAHTVPMIVKSITKDTLTLGFTASGLTISGSVGYQIIEFR